MRLFLRNVLLVYLVYLIGLSSMAPARSGQTALKKTLEVTVLSPRGVEFKELTVSLFPERNKLPFFENQADFRFRLYSTGEKRPLVIMVPGLGSEIYNQGTTHVAEKMFLAGYHVLVVPNNITADFALQVSRSGMPGIVSEDARDLIRALQMSLKKAREEGVQWSDSYLLGYSMGALLSSYVSYYNDRSDKKPLAIKKTILCNPPLNFLRSLHLLDEWNQRIRGEEFIYHRFVKVPTLLTSLWGIIQTNKTSNPDQKSMNRFLDQLYGIPERQLEGALAYGLSLGFPQFVHATQQINDQGLLGGDGAEDPARYDEAAGVSFSSYMNSYIGQLKRGQSIKALAMRNNFHFLSSYFKANKKIYMIHNADDILNRPKDLKRATGYFNGRVHIFPTGGHLGNMWEDSFQRKIIEFIQK